jgi:PBP1b-binding outer membrane lipoprotein LpoB
MVRSPDIGEPVDARVAAPLFLVLLLSGCSQAGNVLEQARGLQEQVESIRWCSDVVRLATAVETTNPAAASNLVAALERTAPDDLAADVKVVRAAVQEIEAGDAQPEDLQRDDVTSAVERLVNAMNQRCAGEIEQELDNNG